jgi:hypothetical protein
MRLSEGRGPGSTPGWGTRLAAAMAVALSGLMSHSEAANPAARDFSNFGGPRDGQSIYLRGVPESIRVYETRGPGSIPGEDTLSQWSVVRSR